MSYAKFRRDLFCGGSAAILEKPMGGLHQPPERTRTNETLRDKDGSLGSGTTGDEWCSF